VSSDVAARGRWHDRGHWPGTRASACGTARRAAGPTAYGETPVAQTDGWSRGNCGVEMTVSGDGRQAQLTVYLIDLFPFTGETCSVQPGPP